MKCHNLSKNCKFLLTIVISLAFLNLVGCGVGGNIGDGDGGDKNLELIYTIYGKLGSTFNLLRMSALNTASALSNGGTYDVDRICVIPAQRTDSGICYLGDIKDSTFFVDINDDGSFSIPIANSDYNWMYLLINSGIADKRDQIVGYISMSDLNETLLSLPSTSVSGDVDYGEINVSDQNPNEAVSSTSLEEVLQSFTIDLSSLREIAKQDDILKGIKNNYVNYNPGTGIAFVVFPSFTWAASNTLIDNNFYDINTNPFDFIGYGPQIGTNDPDITADKVYDQSTILEVIPPTKIDLGESAEEVYDINNPFTTENDEATHGKLQRVERQYDVWVGNKEFQVMTDKNTGESGFCVEAYKNRSGGYDGVQFPEMYEGWWTIKKNGETAAYFDLSLFSPFDDQGNLIVYVPVIKVSNDGQNITRVDVKIYAFENGTYTEVSDNAAIRNIIGRYMLGITYTKDSGTESATQYNYYFDPQITDTEVQLTFTSNDVDREGNALSDIPFDPVNIYSFSYNIGGVNLNFYWKQL